MRTNTMITLGASVAFGVLAIVLARGWINEAIEREFRQAVPVKSETIEMPTVPVVIANAELGFGAVLTPDVLRVVSYPEDAIPFGSFTSLDDVFIDPSQRTVVLSQIAANEALIDTRISGPGGKGSLSALISEGMRAVSVRVDDVAGVAGFIVPGDYVDVVYTRDETTRRNGNNLISDVILQNVKVLGIDQNLNDQSAAPDLANTVTLEVSNEEAQKLHLGMDAGKLSLTLRRAGELTVEPTKTVQQNSLVAAAKARPVYRKPPSMVARLDKKPEVSGTANVTIIRGDERDEVSVIREETTMPSDTQLAGG